MCADLHHCDLGLGSLISEGETLYFDSDLVLADLSAPSQVNIHEVFLRR